MRSVSRSEHPMTQRALCSFRFRFALTAAVWFLAAMPGGLAAQSPMPGTYRLWLCAEVCDLADSSRAIAVATVVILSDSAAQTDPARSALASFRTIRRTGETRPDNVCFHVTHRDRSVGGDELYFGIQPTGATRWHHTATDGFTLRVYLSPDAGYTLKWTETGELRRGEGWSFGWQVHGPSHRNAYFAAIREGDPDLTQCTDTR